MHICKVFMLKIIKCLKNRIKYIYLCLDEEIVMATSICEGYVLIVNIKIVEQKSSILRKCSTVFKHRRRGRI